MSDEKPLETKVVVNPNEYLFQFSKSAKGLVVNFCTPADVVKKHNSQHALGVWGDIHK
jgi:hypothetical protein